MQRRSHRGGLAGDRIVDQLHIAFGELVGVLAALRNIGAHLWVAIAGQGGVVDLQIGAAFACEIGDLVAIYLCERSEKAFPVLVDRRLERLRPQEKVHHRG